MKVIICGAGKVGTSIAKQLILEENDVTVIDQSEELIEKINSSLDVKAFVGFASHPTILEEADAYNTDMIISVTQSDEINMVSCQVAHSIFGISRKIARIRNQNYFTKDMGMFFSSENMPIDVIISPELEVANAILDKLHVPGAIETVDFADGKIKVFSVKTSLDSVINNLTINDANKLLTHLKANIICTMYDEEVYYFNSKELLTSEHEVYVAVDIEDLKETMAIFGHEESEATKIRIIGGGRIGAGLAKKLEQQDNTKITIIERNIKTANQIAEELQFTSVINGDALDKEILEEANISSSDTIISVSNDDEVNILSSLLAKKYGCKKSIALVNSNSFAPLFSSLGIDIIVNPREITVSSILRYIKSFKVRNVHSICHSQAEIIETNAVESAYSVGKTIAELGLPAGVLICLIIRDNEVIVPKSDSEIISEDRLIILSRAEKVKKIEKLFSEKFKYF
jgi:trk system potassium uptake protein TrkA